VQAAPKIAVAVADVAGGLVTGNNASTENQANSDGDKTTA
jgi:hypothetical protein